MFKVILRGFIKFLIPNIFLFPLKYYIFPNKNTDPRDVCNKHINFCNNIPGESNNFMTPNVLTFPREKSGFVVFKMKKKKKSST